jgi:hypothetical protein
MKEHPNGNTFLLCFDNAEHYFKCERGVLLQYQRLPMRMYRRRSEEEVKAYKKQQAKTSTNKAETDNTAEAPKPGNNVAPNETNVSQPYHTVAKLH